MRPLRLAALVCAIAIAIAAGAAEQSDAARGVSVSVRTAPGSTDTVARALRARGFKVNRRSGRRLQVVVTRAAQRTAIARTPGVAGVATAPSAYPDAIVGQGFDRTGAAALSDLANGGAGIRIAVLDLGFGVRVPDLQARGELPPPSRLTMRSFDPAAGLVGANAYGNATDHGELVAQTVYDYAPRATYLFVNYHTPDDFVAAVDWLATQRVDIVVHSNNFLEGPFDGTSPDGPGGGPRGGGGDLVVQLRRQLRREALGRPVGRRQTATASWTGRRRARERCRTPPGQPLDLPPVVAQPARGDPVGPRPRDRASP